MRWRVVDFPCSCRSKDSASVVVDVRDMLTCIENFVPSWRMGDIDASASASLLTDSEAVDWYRIMQEGTKGFHLDHVDVSIRSLKTFVDDEFVMSMSP